MGERPKRFYLKANSKAAANLRADPIEQPPPKGQPAFLEKDLHQFLAHFGFYYLRAHLKTIRSTKSTRKQFGEWVHPDVVGCYFPFGDWTSEVVDVSSLFGATAFKLFSFEIKRELTLSNLREAFFQTVSNSSWANESYLVAAEIDREPELRSELERLSAAFGIGVIRLDIGDPESSEVFLPCRARESVDWETANKLAGLNSDFRDFLKRVRIDIASKEVRKELYDACSTRAIL